MLVDPAVGLVELVDAMDGVGEWAVDHGWIEGYDVEGRLFSGEEIPG